MSAQFFSSLADNALFVAAVELLRAGGAPEWQRAALVPMFALFYVVLAPFVGAFADALPKGRVMFVSNSIKVVGCLMMLFGSHPLLAYAVVGPRRGGLFAGQVRHPDRAAAAFAAGQGQRLDRGPDDRLHHPGRAARRPAGRARMSRRCCWAGPAGASTLGIDTPPEARHRGHRLHLRAGGGVQPVHPAHRCAAAAHERQPAGCWCATSRAATRGCGATSWGRSRWRRRRCSGASPATCATSCSPGPRRRWATARRRRPAWSASSPSAPRWAPCWPRP